MRQKLVIIANTIIVILAVAMHCRIVCYRLSLASVHILLYLAYCVLRYLILAY